MRKRVNPNAVCSSKNYALSKRLHREYLERTHDDRMMSISMMSFSIENPTVTHWTRAYLLVFGKKVYLSREEVQKAIDSGYYVHYEY